MILLVCLFLFLVPIDNTHAAGRAASGKKALASFFPRPPRSAAWHPSDSLRIVEGKDLYHLIDGGADIFLEYGFVRAGSRHYATRAGGEIVLEVYEMQDTAAAWGAFSFMTFGTGTPAPFGQEAVAGEEFLILWKSRFVVSITALNEKGRAGVRWLGRAVDRKIRRSGHRPAIAEVLLTKNFRNREVLLMKGPLSFGRRAHFGIGTVFLAREGSSGTFEECRTFILGYSGTAECDIARLHALRVLKSDSGFQEISGKSMTRVLSRPRGPFVHMSQFDRFLLLTVGEDQDRTLRTAGKLKKAAALLLVRQKSRPSAPKHPPRKVPAHRR